MFTIHRPLRQELLTVGNKLVALEMRSLFLHLELSDVPHEVIDSVILCFGINGNDIIGDALRVGSGIQNKRPNRLHGVTSRKPIAEKQCQGDVRKSLSRITAKQN
jgi:hypothetical protein